MKENNICFLKTTFVKVISFFKAHRITASFICGMIFAAPFFREWLFPLTFLSLLCFFYLTNAEESKKKSRFIYYFAFFFGVFISVYTLFFKLYPFEGFDFSPLVGKIIVIFGWLGASLIHSVMGGVILGISKHFKKSPLLYALSCGALWVIFEFSQTLGFLAFPWVNVSLSLVKFLPFLQTASLFGNGIITFIVVFSCCIASFYFIHPDKKIYLKIASAVMASNLALGCILFVIPEIKDKEVNVLIVQGNVQMGEKWEADRLKTILINHEKLIRDNLANENADIVLLAETVFPAVYTENGLIYQTMSKIAKDFDVTVMFGVLLKSDKEETINAIMAIYPDGTETPYYTKRKLVPFGEKLPSIDILGTIVPSLKELNRVSSYVEGTDAVIINSHTNVKYGPLVCYDSVFPELARENVLLGAEILAVSTNDSWYKDGGAVYQHQKQSIIRAIETGRYVFRSGNTGISCIITSKGIVTAESEIQTKAIILGKGYTSNRKTLFVLLGNSSLYLSFGVILGLIYIKIKKRL
ncbi:MAG: apolipoprotein N-acyltransferase [Ruminococcaceae bacterium]|nr:apolipoprotein N-acyltransferase [Oscillospiraceae bacterium]